jgi:serine/threonine-protein kinase
MAPEQARGQPDIDVRSDVYSLGAILYFLLTSRAPAAPSSAAGSGVGDIAPLIPPRRWDRSIPRPLEAICLKALAPRGIDRYAGVPELAEDVARFLAGQSVEAYAEGPIEFVLRLGMKYRAVLALILAYVLMRIVLLIVARS